MSLQKNDTYTVTIDSLSSDGNGIARIDGRVVFVPSAAVGDVLLVKIVKQAKSHAFARVEEIITPSTDRIAEDCPIAKSCGGCDFRHLTYDAELLAKRQFVADALLRIGHITADVENTLPSPDTMRYRNKVQVPLAPSNDGGITMGFYAKRSHRIISNKDCLLQSHRMNTLLLHVGKLLQNMHLSAYDERTKKGLLRHICLRKSEKSDDILLCLVVTSFDFGKDQDNKKHEFIRDVISEFPEVKTIILNKNSADTNVIYGKESMPIYGDGYINDCISGVPVKLNEHTFSQVNTPAAEGLFALAQKLANPHKNSVLLDLYCGTGVIGLSMAGICKELIGVEIVPAAIESAKQNASAMGLSNTRFLCADAGKAAHKLAEEGIKPDIVMVDPPRKGMDAPAISAVLKMAPQKIVMISCNAATMARDVAIFTENGYSLDSVHPADLFPRTKHVEAVCLLSKL